MTDVSIDWVGVIVAVAVSMVLGGLWYGPVFGKSWIGYVGKTREELRAQGGIGYLVAIVGSFIMAIVMTYVTQWADAIGFGEGLMVGIVMWAGFLISTLVTGSVFEGRPWGLLMLNSGNSLVTFMLVGGIVSSFNT